MRLIRRKEDVDEDIKELCRELEASKLKSQTSVPQLFMTPSLRRPTLVAIVMGWYQNFCGINAVLVFSTQLFVSAGMDDNAAKYATSGTVAIMIIGNIVSSLGLDRFKRKSLFAFSTVGIGACNLILAFTFKYDTVQGMNFVNVIVSLCLTAIYAIGPNCLFWVIITEMFPHSARAAGFSMGVQNASLSFFAHSYLFPEMLIAMNSFAFLVFTGINVLMTVFVITVVPETKNNNNVNSDMELEIN